MEEEIHREIVKLDKMLSHLGIQSGEPEDYEFSHSWEEANWTLRQEWIHQKAVDGAFAHRLKSGDWPGTLNRMQRRLVRLRLFAMLDHVDTLEAWGAAEMATVEIALERVAVQFWPKIRYMEHLRSAVHLPISSVDDPFEEGAPPVWLE